ncbi:type II toxin-antitoxin system PemK/MazF family toxin [Wukongibacter baidiensis]|uniref:type II toxin-antitoxin system PemK/MazF family toxin n=1 Tax=Wukongibacter baidiensis TaxID=1723361 RepID=UPI003D7F29C4
MIIRRGDIFYADLSPVIGSEQGGVRPVLIIQNDIGNKYSPTVIVAAITSQINKAKLPTHIEIDGKKYGLPKDSVILLEQVRTIDKRRFIEKICKLDDEIMSKVNEGLKISLGLTEI